MHKNNSIKECCSANSAIAIAGCPSSGTTLLADLLDCVPRFAAPPELSILNIPSAYFWNECFQQWAVKRRRFITGSNYRPFSQFFNRKYLSVCGLNDNSLDQMIYEAGSLQEFVTLLCEKLTVYRDRPVEVLVENTPTNLNVAELFLNAFPDGRMIVMERNGYAVINSLKRRGFELAEALVIWLYQSWSARQLKGKANVCFVSFEKLVLEPVQALDEISLFCGIKWDSQQIVEKLSLNSYRMMLHRPQSWKAGVGGINKSRAYDAKMDLDPSLLSLLTSLGLQFECEDKVVVSASEILNIPADLTNNHVHNIYQLDISRAKLAVKYPVLNQYRLIPISKVDSLEKHETVSGFNPVLTNCFIPSLIENHVAEAVANEAGGFELPTPPSLPLRSLRIDASPPSDWDRPYDVLMFAASTVPCLLHLLNRRAEVGSMAIKDKPYYGSICSLLGVEMRGGKAQTDRMKGSDVCSNFNVEVWSSSIKSFPTLDELSALRLNLPNKVPKLREILTASNPLEGLAFLAKRLKFGFDKRLGMFCRQPRSAPYAIDYRFDTDPILLLSIIAILRVWDVKPCETVPSIKTAKGTLSIAGRSKRAYGRALLESPKIMSMEYDFPASPGTVVPYLPIVEWVYYRNKVLKKSISDLNFPVVSVDGKTGIRSVVIRHDVDRKLDLKTLKKVRKSERKFGLKSTWFFRRETWDRDLARFLLDEDCELGWHAENIESGDDGMVDRIQNLTNSAPGVNFHGGFGSRYMRGLSSLRACIGHGVSYAEDPTCHTLIPYRVQLEGSPLWVTPPSIKVQSNPAQLNRHMELYYKYGGLAVIEDHPDRYDQSVENVITKMLNNGFTPRRLDKEMTIFKYSEIGIKLMVNRDEYLIEVDRRLKNRIQVDYKRKGRKKLQLVFI